MTTEPELSPESLTKLAELTELIQKAAGDFRITEGTMRERINLVKKETGIDDTEEAFGIAKELSERRATLFKKITSATEGSHLTNFPTLLRLYCAMEHDLDLVEAVIERLPRQSRTLFNEHLLELIRSIEGLKENRPDVSDITPHVEELLQQIKAEHEQTPDEPDYSSYWKKF